MSRELFVEPILVVQMVAVVRREHPLLAIRRRLTHSGLMQHMLVSIESAASGSLKHQPRLPAQRVLPVINRRNQYELSDLFDLFLGRTIL
jgi:hypothetical protein